MIINYFQSLYSLHKSSRINNICRQQWRRAGQTETGLRKLALTAAQTLCVCQTNEQYTQLQNSS